MGTLCGDLNQRHRLVFDAGAEGGASASNVWVAASNVRGARVRVQHLVSALGKMESRSKLAHAGESPPKGGRPAASSRADGSYGDERKRSAWALHESFESMREQTRKGCVLPLCRLIKDLSRGGEIDGHTRAAAVTALKAVAVNSSVCREAVVANGGVKILVNAATHGDEALREDVTEILGDLALTPVTREALALDSSALLFLLRYKVARDRDAAPAATNKTIVANADRALKHLSTEPALVYLRALESCVDRMNGWDAVRSVRAERRSLVSTVGLALLRPGFDELLRLVCRGLETETRHVQAARAMVEHGAVGPLLDCLRVRDAAIIESVASGLASLLNHVSDASQIDHGERRLVADRLLSLIWPLSHRAARTVQAVFRRRKRGAGDGGRAAREVAFVPVSPQLVGHLALALERADSRHDLGGYLVSNGALEALSARMTPDWHRHDEETTRASDRERMSARASAARASTAAAPNRLPPVVQVLIFEVLCYAPSDHHGYNLLVGGGRSWSKSF